MASEQLSRRENITNERDIRVEKDRVPKMTTHFEQLTVHGNEPPHGTIDALHGGEINKDRAAKAIGDVGGRGKARETHELGSHFEPIADKLKAQNTPTTDHHRTTAAANVVPDKKRSEEKGREAFGGARDVGKFEMKTEGGKTLGGESLDRGNVNREVLERRTRVVEGTTPQNNKGSSVLEAGKGGVVAEKGRLGAEAMGDEKVRGRVDAPEREGVLWGKGGVQKERLGAQAMAEDTLRGRVGAAAQNEGAMLGKSAERAAREIEENKSPTLEEISKYRNQAQETAMNAISAAQERYEKAKQATNEALSSTTQTAQQKASQAKDATLEKGQQGYEATKDTVSNAGKTAQQKAAQAKDLTLEKGQQGYEATKDTVSNAAKTAQQKALQAKDVTLEKGQQGYEATKDTVSNAAKAAQQKAAQAKDVTLEKGQQGYEATKDTISNAAKTAQQKALQAKDVTLEKGQQGYEATKDTVSNAAKTAAEYTTPAVEKAKSATGTTVSYVGEKAAKAKEVTLETGKTAVEIAGKVAADLKDKATVAGWTAANISAELTVGGTKAAANVVEGVAGYTGHKAAELAAKSVDVVKNLAASAGETAKEYTARKKEESWREYEAKRSIQPQEVEGRTTEEIGETMSNYAQNVTPSGENNQGFQAQGNYGQKVMPNVERNQGFQAQGTFNTNQQGRGGSNVMSGVGSGGEGKRVGAGEIQGNKENEGMSMTTNIGDKLSDAAQTMKKPLQNITEGGKEVMRAVTETVGNIGSNIIKPTEKVQERSTQEVQSGGGVLDAIGETIAEIAQTTKVIVVGEDDKESNQNIGVTNRATHEHDQPPIKF